jgi:hypothetical protein
LNSTPLLILNFWHKIRQLMDLNEFLNLFHDLWVVHKVNRLSFHYKSSK